MRSTSIRSVLILLICCLITFSAGAATSVVKLRCENKTDPLGIDAEHPRLSWQMTSDRRGDAQTAYRVLAASSADALRDNHGDLWDTGKIASDQSTAVEYGGTSLRDSETIHWKVIVWNADGKELASEPATFETGLVSAKSWQAKWIDSPAAQSQEKPGGTAQKPIYPPNTPPYFRKTFGVNKTVSRARLYATAMGLYICSINGQRVGDILLAPDWTDYHKRVRYQTYDVTSMLRQGDNAMGAILSDGWYAGHVAWLGGHAYGQRPAFFAQLVIDFSDGTSQTIATDESWKTTTGPMLISDLLQGEDYDARKEIPGWDGTTFDDSKWSAASLRDDKALPELQAQIAPPVRKLMELPTREVKEPAKGRFNFDLGQNMVGFARLKVSGAEPGSKITLRFAEMLNPDGTIYTENLRAARATDTYVCRGGDEIFEPHFTFHGFRYVEVTGFPGTPTSDAITGIVIGSDNPTTGSFECSNPILNKLQSNIVWGQRGNYVSVPTDCPQRDERQGWMGDAQVFIRTATFLSDVHEFFDNWLVDVADAQSDNGAFTDISPRPAKTAGDGVAAWADAGIICPWTIYQAYGDTRILARQYDSMAKFIVYLQHNSDHLIRPAKGYGDWLSIEADTPKDVLATAYFAYSTHLMSKIAAALGKTEDAAKFQQLFDDIRKAFNGKFVAADGRITGNTQTCYLIALKFELLGEAKQAQAVKYLLEDIAAKKDHLSTGFVGVSYLLPILTKYGQTDVAYHLLNQDTFPSWLFSVKQGATTIWERWDGWTPEKGFQTPKMNSFNHYSLGSCGEWMYDTIGGIGLDPAHPGYKHILIHPRPGGGLTWARASYDSDYGPIKTDWKIDGGKFTLIVDVPANTSATVSLPGADGKELTESGKPGAEAEGVKLSQGSGEISADVGAGHYEFTAPAAQQP